MLPQTLSQTTKQHICVQNCSYTLFSVVPSCRGKSDTYRYLTTSSKTTCRCSLPLMFIGTAIFRDPCFKHFASQLKPERGLKSQHKLPSPYHLSLGLAEQLLATKIDMQKRLHIFRRKAENTNFKRSKGGRR